MTSKKHLLLLSSLIISTAAQVESTGTNPEECLTSSSVVWAVLGTIMILFAISIGAYALWRYYWRSRKGEHLVLVTADAEKGDKFAFDNHAFKDGNSVERTLENDKLNGIKWPEFISSQNGNTKSRSMDDTCVGQQEAAKNIVPLRSHDFTGLGFNIYGNMRDGIFIKDVSHRGPAMESGKIQPGDRITSVRISFHHMVYEDALTILSYASPYEVQIETENGIGKVNSRPSTLLRNKPASTSPGEKIAHPLFRSQSISDLAQISSKRISINSHHNTSQLSTHEPNDKPAILEVTSNVVKSDKAHKFGIRVLPDMKPEINHTNAAPQSVILTIEHDTQINNYMLTEQKTHHDQSFDEIDLSPKNRSIDESDQRANTPSPTTNVKSIIAKGFQNLKGKLPHHKKQSSLDNNSSKQNSLSSDSCVIDMTPSSINIVQRMEEKILPNRPEENRVETDAQHIMKTFLENEKAHTADLKSPSPISIVSKTDSFSSTEGDGSKRSKRKAPAPPVTTDVELHAEPMETISSKDSDSEIGDNSSTTIELNSSHITIHSIPDDSDRRAASLGDLSKMTNKDEVIATSVLERAMSLELAEGNVNTRDSKKRKAPNPPADEMVEDEASFAKEPRMEPGLGLTSLKKASLFGTLEEAMQHTEDEADSMTSPPSGQSSPDISEISDKDIVSSTPLRVINTDNKKEVSKEETTTTTTAGNKPNIKEQNKPQPAQRTITDIKIETNEITNNEKAITIENGHDDSVDNGHFIKDIIGDFSKEMNGEFSKGMNGVWHANTPEKIAEITSKDWELSETLTKEAYTTALNISVEDKPPDLPSSPPPNINSFVTEIKVRNRLDDNEEDEILDISDKDMTLLEQECDDSKIFKNGVYFTTDESLLMNGSMSPFTKSSLISSSSETKKVVPPSKIETFLNNNNKTTSDMNLSDEQILALKTSTNKLTNNLYKTNGESPSPNKRRIPSKSPSPSSGKSPLRGNMSISSIKSSGSRIPIRAFSNNSSSSSSSTSSESSTSPRSISMIPDLKVRKSRKPDEQETRFSYSSSFTVSPITKSNVPSPERRYNGANGTIESSGIMIDNQK